MVNKSFNFVSIHYPFNTKDAIRVVTNTKSIQEYKEYIQANDIVKAEIVMPDLNIIKECPSLTHLKIVPSFNAPKNFDFSPLYDIPQIKSLYCQNQYGNRGQYLSTVDYAKVKGLIELSVIANEGSINFNRINTLKSLRVGGFKGATHDISDLFCSTELDTLQLTECQVKSLRGIEKAPKIQCLYLYYNRSLSDISSLRSVKKSLKALRIENCPKIEDFSVLGELENLELLELSGKNELPNLDFLAPMKNLKTFVFNVNIKDGDLSLCKNLQYVYSSVNRKHYNLKDAALPKGKYVRGNENIEEWRRLE